jgi:endo-1,4-beta-mannosidase
MHEFGICTAPAGSPGVSITDDFLGRELPQYLASEGEGALYYSEVLGRLLATGAAGAYAWCYADYHSRLFERPPFDRALRERSFGLVRADGSEKPAADVFRRFARELTRGNVKTGAIPKLLDVTPDVYYAAPQEHFSRLYARWLGARDPAAESR